MININGKKYKIITKTIKFQNEIYNKVNGYFPTIHIRFINKDIEGYIMFDLEFCNTKDFNNIINKKYIGNPSDFNSKVSCVEIFDTEKFIDYVDSDVYFELRNIVDNGIECQLKIDDSAIKLEFEGELDIASD